MGIFDRLFGRRDDPVARELAAWAIVTANDATGEVAVFRVRKTRPPIDNLDEFRTAVVLTWAYSSPDGLPPPELKVHMDELDTALDPLSWRNGFAELVLVSTGLGMREWLFYVADIDRFWREFERATLGGWDWAIETTAEDDPGWERWRLVSERVA